MSWQNIVKNREIKIPKRKKRGEIDTSKFYSRPAQKESKEKPKAFPTTPKSQRKQPSGKQFKPKREPINFKQRADKLKNRIEELKKLIEDLPRIEQYHANDALYPIEQDLDKLIERTKKTDGDTFEKKAGGYSFGSHGANPELFNIKYGGGKRGKKRREEKVRD
tara:strand:- start:1165 stop:1656 length:492 start_codon:yes stop_codon:yes gene_type:complete